MPRLPQTILHDQGRGVHRRCARPADASQEIVLVTSRCSAKVTAHRHERARFAATVIADAEKWLWHRFHVAAALVTHAEVEVDPVVPAQGPGRIGSWFSK